MDGSISRQEQCITIVAGLPRSGTSMMMQMLKAGGMPVATDGVRLADEDNPKGYLELEAVKLLRTRPCEGVLEGLCGKAVKMVHLLLYHLPQGRFRYKVILMRRHLEEVVASQRVMLERRGCSAVGDDAEFVVMFRREMDRLESWLKLRLDISSLPISYNALLEQPRLHAELVNEHLTGNLDLSRMLSVVDASLHRQRGEASRKPG